MATEEQNIAKMATVAEKFKSAAEKFQTSVKEGVAQGKAEAEGGSSGVAKAIGDEIKKPLETMFAPISGTFKTIKNLPDMLPGNKIFKAMGKSIMEQGKLAKATGAENKAAAQEDADEKARQDKRTSNSIVKIAKTTTLMLGVLKELMKKLLEGAGKGLGALAGLLFAPLAFFSGLLSGLLDSVKKLAKLVPIKTLTKAFKSLGGVLRAIAKFVTLGISEALILKAQKAMQKVSGGLKRIPNFFKGIGTFFAAKGGFFGIIRGAMGLGVDGKPVVTTPKWAKTALKTWTSIKTGFASIGKAFGTVGKFLSPVVKGFKAVFGPIITFSKTVGRILGKLFYPITLVIAAFDTITGAIDGFKKGGVTGAIKGGITGLINSLIGAPLDLLKSGVAWILKKFGFDETSEALKGFSFSKLITDIIDGVFKYIGKMVAWVKLLFTDPVVALTVLWTKLVGKGGLLEIVFAPLKAAWNWIKTLFTSPLVALQALWTGLVGKGGLLDILWSPVNTVIDWITKKFGWRDEDAPKFNLLKTITDALSSVWTWLKGIFDIDVSAFVAKMPPAIQWLAGKAGVIDEDAIAMSKMSPEEKKQFTADKAAAALEEKAKEEQAAANVKKARAGSQNRILMQRQKTNESMMKGARRRLAAAQKEQSIVQAEGTIYGRKDRSKTAEEKAEDLARVNKAQEELKRLEERRGARQQAIETNNNVINNPKESNYQVVTAVTVRSEINKKYPRR